MAFGISLQANSLHCRLPGLLHGARPRCRAARMADNAAAAQIEQLRCSPGPLKCFRCLTAPLAGTGDRQGAVFFGKYRCRHCLETLDKAFVRFPVFDANAVDLKLVHAQEPPENLPDFEVHSETGMAGENVPAIAMRVQNQRRAFAQEGHAAKTDRIDVDHRAIAACFDDDVMVAHQLVRIGMGNAECIHDFFSSFLLVIQDFWHDRRHAVFQRRIGRRHQLLVVLDEIDA